MTRCRDGPEQLGHDALDAPQGRAGRQEGRPGDGAAGAALRPAVPPAIIAIFLVAGRRRRRRSRVATPVLAGNVINAITRGSPGAGARGHPDRAAHRRARGRRRGARRSASGSISARIGEGIIYDLRTQVYDHVQRMPLQFFTRTQTGALVSRLNNDVIGRPAGVHLDAVRHGRQRHRAGPHRRRDVLAVLAGHRAVAGAGAGCSCCRPGCVGPPAGRDHPRVLPARREDERHHDRAVRRGRRAAGQAVRPARRRGRRGSPRGPAGCATSACSRRCTARTFFVGDDAGRLAGAGAHLRRSAAGSRSAAPISAGTVVTLALLLTRLYGPITALSNVRVNVMSALVSFERVFEVLDLPPAIAEQPGRGRRAGGHRQGRVPRRARSATRPRPRSRWPRWRTWPRWTARSPSRCCAGVSFTVRAGPDGRAGRPVRRRQVDHRDAACRGSTT